MKEGEIALNKVLKGEISVVELSDRNCRLALMELVKQVKRK